LKQDTTPINNPLSGREQLLNHLVEGVKDYAIFLLDPKGNVLSWNKGAERIKGFRQDEVLGKNFSIFYTEEDQAAGRPQQALTEAVQKGRYNDEAWRIRKDGSRFWANIFITPLYDTNGTLQGFTKITRDLSDLRKSEEKFKWIIESAPDSIVIVNFEGKIQMVNAQTEKLFGYDRKELFGKEVEALIPDRFVEKHYRHRQAYNMDPKTRAMGVGLALFGKRRNGDEFPVEVSLSPVNMVD
jgi:PAS domain S-box-containing protein